MCFTCVLLAATPAARAALGEDTTVDLVASVSDTAPHITLNWGLRVTWAPGDQRLYRRVQGASRWSQTNLLSATAVQYVDSSAMPGVRYEYWLHRTYSASPYSADGHLLAGLHIAPVEQRGALVLLVDATIAGALVREISELQQDLIGDGWRVLRHDVPRSMAVTNVRALIRQDYLADTTSVSAVYLLGHVPVPYAGDIAPDGHANHVGAWPADVYYAEMNGTWTDASVNDAAASDTRNRNVPGDGKFDQSSLPSDAELQIGRVDMYNMTVFPNTAADEISLTRRYLRRAHDYRQKQGAFGNDVPRRVLVDDNFGSYGASEGFANTAYRTAAAWGGRGAYVSADWFDTLATGVYLFAYGCGAGSYTAATGVGTSGDFGLRPSKALFTGIFGSYHGDWDYPNGLMRACLAAHDDSYSLSCAWAGRPQWFFQHMALGEPIGYSARLTQNNSYSDLPPAGSSARQVHIALLGDPTLRLYPVLPPQNFRARAGAGVADLAWDAPPDTNVLGCYLYRAATVTAPFARVTNDLLAATFYTDAALGGLTSAVYLLRAVKVERSASGTYTNLSQGAFAFVQLDMPASFNPNGLVATAPSSSWIYLAWHDNSSDEIGFLIERATTPTGAFSVLATTDPDTNFYADASLMPIGAPWYYRVSALGAGATSAPSNIATVQANTAFFDAPNSIQLCDVSEPLVTVPIRRYGGQYGSASLPWNTGNNTALNGRDYVGTNITLVWPNGMLGVLTATVQTVTQPLPRLPRSFKVLLGTPTGGAILSSARSTIVLLTDARATLPAPWQSIFLNTARHAGAVAAAEGVIGSAVFGGSLPDGSGDSCRFIYQPRTGDTLFTTYVNMEPRTSTARMAIMARANLNHYCPAVHVRVGDNRITLERRTNDYGATITNGYVSFSAGPVWLRLQRAGNTFTAFYSANNSTWTRIDSVSLPLASVIPWGMGHSSDIGVGDFHLATFSNTTVAAFISSKPVASNDTASMLEDGGTIVIRPLLNDYDPDGSPLTLISAGPDANATLQIIGSTNLAYRPVVNYFGTDTFAYVAQELHGLVATAQVTVIVQPVNDAPQASALRLFTPLGVPVSFVVAAADVERDPLTFTLLQGPAHGALTGALPALTYQPATNFSGLETLCVAVADTWGATCTTFVWISVAPASQVGTALRAFGNNNFGQLGLGHTTNVLAPMLVTNPGVVAVCAAGLYHSLALDAHGVPWACGMNWYGQLGTGTNLARSVFVRVNTLTGIVDIDAGMLHSLFLGSNGLVYACGYGGQGALGDGTNLTRLAPVLVPGLTNIVDIDAGGYASYALDAAGHIWAWGDGASGQLGNGTNLNQYVPVQMAGVSNIVALAAGVSHVLALDSNHTPWVLGYNDDGELGLGHNTEQWLPVPVPGMTDVLAVAAGLYESHLIRADGSAWSSGGSTNIFVQLYGSVVARSIAAGNGFALASTADGRVYVAGNNASGQLGLGTTISTNMFVLHPSLQQIVAASCGSDHALVLARTVTNRAPVARNLVVTATPSQTVSITLSATDAENDALSYQVLDQPRYGTLNGTPPSLAYTAEGVFICTDTFTYIAADLQPSEVATVRILVVPEPAICAVIGIAVVARRIRTTRRRARRCTPPPGMPV